MNTREQLIYLCLELARDNYKINDFCLEFARIYNYELDTSLLSENEKNIFEKISIMSDRFSDNPDDLKLPNVYFSEIQICNEVKLLTQLIENS